MAFWAAMASRIRGNGALLPSVLPLLPAFDAIRSALLCSPCAAKRNSG